MAGLVTSELGTPDGNKMDLATMPSALGQHLTQLANVAAWCSAVAAAATTFYFVAPAFSMRNTRDSHIDLWGLTAFLAAGFGFSLGKVFGTLARSAACCLPLNSWPCSYQRPPFSTDWIAAASAAVAALITVHSHFSSLPIKPPDDET